jgi:hypothetical protein
MVNKNYVVAFIDLVEVFHRKDVRAESVGNAADKVRAIFGDVSIIEITESLPVHID